MRLNRSLLSSIVTTAVAVTLAVSLAGPAGAKPGNDPKPDPGARDTSAQLVAADAAFQASQGSAALNRASSKVQARIQSFVRTHGTTHTFGSYADPATGRIVIETDAPSEVIDSLIADAGAAVDVRRQSVSDSFSRRDDVAPFWGGAGIVLTTGVPQCSSGYTVKNSAGTRFMVTAGHCFSNGQTVRTEIGGRVVGTVSGNGLPSQDMELIGGQSYAPSIYIGGVNSTTGAHVGSAADPVVNFNNYCHSGRTTGENCGHTVTSVNAQVCTSSGCKSPVIAFTGGVLPQGGDSGSPFYANSTSGSDKHIRGHIIAVGGGTAYAEKWSRVAARFGVTIVT
ncbi:MAG TPA: S1 family peptidase [Nakamurella sp.]